MLKVQPVAGPARAVAVHYQGHVTKASQASLLDGGQRRVSGCVPLLFRSALLTSPLVAGHHFCIFLWVLVTGVNCDGHAQDRRHARLLYYSQAASFIILRCWNVFMTKFGCHILLSQC